MEYNISLLKKDLVGFRDDALVLIDGNNPKGLQNLSNGSLYISTTPKIGECNICGHAVYGVKNYTEGKYVGYCPECKSHKTENKILKKK